MKLSEKIYLSTLILFLIGINITLCLCFYFSYSNSLTTQKNTSYSQWLTITGTFKEELAALEARDNFSTNTISVLIDKYNLRYQESGLNFDVFMLENEQFMPINPEDTELLYDRFFDNLDNVNRMVFERDDETHIAIGGQVSLQDDYFFVMTKQLVGFKAMWGRMIVIFLAMELAISIVLAIGLSILLKRHLKLLEQLLNATKLMTEGELEQLIPVAGKDELAILVAHFNEMSKTVSTSLKLIEEESEKKQQFIDDLAHEMRTPLTTIKGYAQLLQLLELDENKRMQYTSYIVSEADRIHLMSDELLKLTLIKQEPLSFDYFKNDVFLTEVISPLELLMQDKRIRLSYESDDRVSYGNKILLQNVLTNLVKNAFNACEDEDEIYVGVFKNRMVVKDSGRGMSEQCCNRLFEPFYREDKSRSRENFGAGLGMAICYEIIKCHHGEIKVSSSLGIGTVIEIYVSE